MKLTIPAPQNIKRREAYLLQHADKLPKTYVQAQLLKIAMIRAEKKLRWEIPQRVVSQEERDSQKKRIEASKSMFTPVKPKQTFFLRIKGMFKSQRGN